MIVETVRITFDVTIQNLGRDDMPQRPHPPMPDLRYDPAPDLVPETRLDQGNLIFDAACDRCGADAVWHQWAYGATKYRVECERCDHSG